MFSCLKFSQNREIALLKKHKTKCFYIIKYINVKWYKSRKQTISKLYFLLFFHKRIGNYAAAQMTSFLDQSVAHFKGFRLWSKFVNNFQVVVPSIRLKRAQPS